MGKSSLEETKSMPNKSSSAFDRCNASLFLELADNGLDARAAMKALRFIEERGVRFTIPDEYLLPAERAENAETGRPETVASA
jgi:hypothetical protein